MFEYKKHYIERFDEKQFIDRFNQVYRDLKHSLEETNRYAVSYPRFVQNYRSCQVYAEVYKKHETMSWRYGPTVHKVGIIFQPVGLPNGVNETQSYSEETYVTSQTDRKSKNYVKDPKDMLGFITL